MTSMTIFLSRGVGSLRFNKSSVGGQAAIEFILFAVMLIIAFAFFIMPYLDNGGVRNGRDSPDVVLTDSDSVKTDEAQEQADNTEANSARTQAAESQRQRFNWWWIMNNQMLMNMRNHSD